MNYLIVAAKDDHGNIGYYCAQNLVRQLDSNNKEVVSFTCSGRLTTIAIERFVGAFPHTPTYDQMAKF